MGLLRKIRDYFVTDVEVVLEQSSDDLFRETASSTVGGGALTTMGEGKSIRYVFHGAAVLGPGSYVRLEKAHREMLHISRGPFGALHLVSQGPGDLDGINIEISLPLDKPLTLWEGSGMVVTARRFRHRDFQLFPDSTTAA